MPNFISALQKKGKKKERKTEKKNNKNKDDIVMFPCDIAPFYR